MPVNLGPSTLRWLLFKLSMVAEYPNEVMETMIVTLLGKCQVLEEYKEFIFT
jgi:hypothetical protein